VDTEAEGRTPVERRAQGPPEGCLWAL